MAKAQQAKAKKTSVKNYHNYIGGEWVKSSSGDWFENVNPADSNDVVGRFPLSNADDVNRAVDAAKSAATRWRKTPAPKRAEILFRLGDIISKNKDRFSSEMTREMADPGQDPRDAPDIASLWNVLDLTPQGRGTDWYPALEY